MDLLAMSAWNLHRNMANSAQRLPIGMHRRDQREARSGAPENQPKPLGYANIPHPRCLPPWSWILHHSRASVEDCSGMRSQSQPDFYRRPPEFVVRSADMCLGKLIRAMRFPNRVEDGPM